MTLSSRNRVLEETKVPEEGRLGGVARGEGGPGQARVLSEHGRCHPRRRLCRAGGQPPCAGDWGPPSSSEPPSLRIIQVFRPEKPEPGRHGPQLKSKGTCVCVRHVDDFLSCRCSPVVSVLAASLGIREGNSL